MWGPPILSGLVTCGSGTSVRSGLLYGTDDYMKAPHIVYSGANFAVCSARTPGLVLIHIAVPCP
jgi:hypothetical protein